MAISLFQKKKKSGSVATDRLRLTLTSERAGCSSETMELIRRDIIAVISKYVEVDLEGIDIKVTSSGLSDDGPSLSANIPIKEIKRKDTYTR